MKRFILILLAFAFLPTMTIDVQVMAVVDATVQTLVSGSMVEQAIYWFQQASVQTFMNG
jgi:hypothetical protein